MTENKCTRCNREFVMVETVNEMSKALKTRKTYKIKERKFKWSTREYCGFCGVWIR